jgi:hypothetical protein
MTTTAARTAERSVLVTSALAACLLAASGSARAAESDEPASAAPERARREVVLALGYGSTVAPRGIVVYRNAQAAESIAAFDGFSVDVTRRLPVFEYGARFWKMGGSSDGKGSSAHVLTRWTTEARFYPWRLRTVEPWIGAEFGLGLADDFAVWNQTEKEPAHQVVAGVRPGLVGGLEAGGRLRLASLIALGVRGGVLFLGFERAGGRVIESASMAKYAVQPTDYGRRLWLSFALTAELTVPD